MHAYRRHDLDRWPLDFRALAFDIDQSRSSADVEKLREVGMTVLANLSVIQAAALRDRLAMKQVRRAPVMTFPIELEDRNVVQGRMLHCLIAPDGVGAAPVAPVFNKSNQCARACARSPLGPLLPC